MARTNSRPDTIYVKSLTKEDKDRFEMLLKHLKTTNNGYAVLKVIENYFPLMEKNKKLEDQLRKMEGIIRKKDEKLNKMTEQKTAMLEQIGVIEKSLKSTSEFIKEL
jgi:septal ring factor EnvC (AmiA/AmiB activator)